MSSDRARKTAAGARVHPGDELGSGGEPGRGHGHGHGHGHPHAHGHHHWHETARSGSRRRLAAALALLVAFLVAEVVAAIVSGSLALLSDAAHMLTDAGALALALVAARLAARPPAGGYTYGLRRAEVISAQANGLTLIVFGLVILYEAARRFVTPPTVDGPIVVATALAGIAVNLACVRILAGAERRSLNVEGAFQHVLTDLFAFIATAVAGAIVWAGGSPRADGVAAALVALLMLRSGWALVREATHVLLEGAPRGVDPSRLVAELAADPEVVDVHDLHVWEVTSGFPALSAHVIVRPGSDCHAARRRLAEVARSRFGIEHTTFQVEHAIAPGRNLSLAPGGEPRNGDHAKRPNAR